MVRHSSNGWHWPRQSASELFFPSFLTIPSILIIARALRSCHLLNKLPEGTYLTLDSVMLGDNSLERTYFVDVAREGGSGIVELGLELSENWCGVMWIARLIRGGGSNGG